MQTRLDYGLTPTLCAKSRFDGRENLIVGECKGLYVERVKVV
jgi:hypothetical protein